MKKKLYYLFMLPLLLLSSCTSGDEDFDKRVIGTWDVQSNRTKVVLIDMPSDETLENKIKADYDFKTIELRSDQTPVIHLNDPTTRASELDNDYYEAKDNILSIKINGEYITPMRYSISTDGILQLDFSTFEYKNDGVDEAQILMYAKRR